MEFACQRRTRLLNSACTPAPLLLAQFWPSTLLCKYRGMEYTTAPITASIKDEQMGELAVGGDPAVAVAAAG
jgi:hypothetical protein